MPLHLHSSQTLLSQSKTKFFMGLSKFFTENSLMHYHIVFIPRTHKKCFPLISRCVDSFTLAFDL